MTLNVAVKETMTFQHALLLLVPTQGW